MRIQALLALSLMAGSFAACAPEETGPGQPVETLPFEFVAPSLNQIAPNAVALGDTVQVFGSGFVTSEYADTFLNFNGSYTDDLGATQKFQGSVPIQVQDSSIATFEFDHLIFAPGGQRIGAFDGVATVTTKLKDRYKASVDKAEETSGDHTARISIRPSLQLVQLNSVSTTGCDPVTKATIGGQELGLHVRAIGVEPASVAFPIRFQVGFSGDIFTVEYMKEDDITLNFDWPVIQLDPGFKGTAQGESKFEVEVTEGNEMIINPRARRTSVRVTPPVQMGQFLEDRVFLHRFSTGNTEGKSKKSGMLLEARLPSGETITRFVKFDVREAWEVQQYDQSVKLMERSDPVPVSGCFSGGDIGRDLTYTEGTSITKSRSLNFRWDRNTADSFGLNAGTGGLAPVTFVTNSNTTFSETFGVDINESVSSEGHEGTSFSAKIIPGYFGTCYRQVDRLQREVDAVYTNACGASGVVGQFTLTDWNYGFDIATGPSCDEPSTLEPGASYGEEGLPL